MKTKLRALNQEKYFLARITINDTQHKKEHLKLMASVGLNYVGVDAHYSFVPPRFMVSCDPLELSTQHEQVVAMMKEVSAGSLSLPAQTYRDYMKALRYASGSREEDNVESETTRIRLGDNNSGQTRTDLNAPAVHLRVHIPHGEQVRTDYFVVDDFWEFVQIKFDDLVPGPEDPQVDPVDAMGAGKYEVDHPEHYTPEIKEIMRRRRLFDFEKALAVKSLDNQIKKCEDVFMLQVK